MQMPAPFRRFLRQEEGNATVEFAILVPLLFAIFVATLEGGLMMSRWAGIDRAADMVIRNLRLGQYENPTAELLRQEVCDEVFLVENCYENTAVDIREIDRATCVERLATRTKQYAKRQDTWLRRLHHAEIVDADRPAAEVAGEIAGRVRGG